MTARGIATTVFLAFALATAPTAVAESMRRLKHAAGVTEIPANPQRIVSLHDSDITLPLLELGAPVVGSHGRLGEGGKPYMRGVRDFLGVGFEESGITFIGAYNAIDIELVAVLAPDLIITTPWQASAVPQLGKIAPVVVIPWEENSLEVHRRLADAAGRLEAFKARRARYEARVEALRTWIGDPGRISIAMIQAWDGQLRVYRNYGAFAQVVEDVGFAEPPLVAELPRDGATLSAELLPQIDADFVFDTFEPNFGDTPQGARARMDGVLPGWCRRLFACWHGQYILLPRTRVASNAFAAYDFVIGQLVTHIAGREYVLFEEQAGARND